LTSLHVHPENLQIRLFVGLELIADCGVFFFPLLQLLSIRVCSFVLAATILVESVFYSREAPTMQLFRKQSRLTARFGQWPSRQHVCRSCGGICFLRAFHKSNDIHAVFITAKMAVTY